MRSFLRATAFSVALFLPLQATAQEGAETAIQGVISDQFDAFLDEDVNTAWTYASPTIQMLFRTPENFGAMVRNGYPMVWAPTETKFLELRDEDGVPWQRVQVRDAAGQYHVLDYKMVETPDGWLIDAVEFIESIGVGV
ncbi:DUF4864 domain-containing protein [Maritimibacter dapengensis]|uniref:DUF4864 domain-containing protein n=1 Tax=Maritimibacter dapengensis TaxID=2836868 RepID=A0ABS6SZ05_9RHOB|nr:DUF4864 domain-containing protein [Maritimibacter dapengensis]MBV7378205.1 DUF4864 domain-containing protein [Maritimibacter dapengensis]